jgi:hypothetical protein
MTKGNRTRKISNIFYLSVVLKTVLYVFMFTVHKGSLSAPYGTTSSQ